MKKSFVLLLLCWLAGSPFFSQAQAELHQGQEQLKEKSVDERINEFMAPIVEKIFDVIFYPITIKGPQLAEVSGQIIAINHLETNYTQFTIELADGNTTRIEVPTPRRNRDLQQGATIEAGQPITRPLAMPFVVLWLIAGALVFTFYFRFVNFRQFRLAIDIVRGKYTDPNDKGEVSHFQALTTALSGTVGLGNIAGVAVAISIGGPGATFWMIVAGLLGMSSKFAECTLGVKYRNIGEDGVVHGGPMYYLSKGLKEKGWGGLGKFLAVFFAIMCVGASFGGGNMFQVNQAYQQFSGIVPGHVPGWVFGIFMAIIVGVVIIGGIKSIANVTEKIVPFMVGIYVVAALAVLFSHFGSIPSAFARIFEGAFDSKALYGGFIGVLIVGFQRAAFSNEAGIGSASIAHAAVKTKNPVSEGLVSLLEPFIDTVVVCTMTALVIIVTDNYRQVEGIDGVTLTSQSFATVISWFPYVLSLAVILFAFSTMISWSYYGLQSWTYVFGNNTLADYSYKIIFCIFIVIGSAMSLGGVIDFSDAMIFAMCFPNIIGLYLLMPVVKKELNNYLQKIRSGEIARHD